MAFLAFSGAETLGLATGAGIGIMAAKSHFPTDIGYHGWDTTPSTHAPSPYQDTGEWGHTVYTPIKAPGADTTLSKPTDNHHDPSDPYGNVMHKEASSHSITNIQPIKHINNPPPVKPYVPKTPTPKPPSTPSAPSKTIIVPPKTVIVGPPKIVLPPKSFDVGGSPKIVLPPKDLISHTSMVRAVNVTGPPQTYVGAAGNSHGFGAVAQTQVPLEVGHQTLLPGANVTVAGPYGHPQVVGAGVSLEIPIN